jgi:hypothetical protein
MKIELTRIYNCPTYCIGRVRVDNVYICDTIEDTDRGLDDSMTREQIRKIKVYKMTAIPTGTYDVTLAIQSPKFVTYEYYRDFCNGYLPRLIGVKGYEGILIHKGNKASQSAGCLLVGYNTVKGCVTSSQAAFEKLYGILKAAHDRREKITITINRTYQVK